jgi:oligosaccharide repeat unit polymerase
MLINYLFIVAILPFIYEKIVRGKVDIFSPKAIFSFFYLLLFGIRALDLLFFRPEVFLADEKYYVYALIYAIVGLHFFQIGYFSKLGQLFFRHKQFIPDNWSRAKFKIVLFSYSAISLISFLIIIKLSGGFSSYFSNIRNAMVGITSGKTFLFISVLLINIPLLIMFCYILEKKKSIFNFVIFFLFASILLASLGERGHFVMLIISLLICIHYLKRNIHSLSIVAISTALIIFLVIYGQYRDFTEKSHKIKKIGFDVNIGLLTTYGYFIGHFDQLRHVKDVVMAVPDQLDFQMGKTFLNLLVKLIPSAIWENKPQGAGQVVTKYIYPKAFNLNVTVAPSLLAELYLNFHIIGIIIGFFLFGVLCKSLYYFLIKNNKNKNAVILYSISLPYVFSELRGDFTIVTSFLIFNLTFSFVALNYISKKTR